jgi:hypothetical protein
LLHRELHARVDELRTLKLSGQQADVMERADEIRALGATLIEHLQSLIA